MRYLKDLYAITLVALAIFLKIRLFKVKDLHRELLTGELEAQGFYRFLRTDQIPEFISYHQLVKQLMGLFEPLPQGVTEDETAIRMHEIERFVLAHPELKTWIPDHLHYGLNMEKRRRLFVGMSQIDNMIECDLEKSILRASKKSNIIRRAN